MSNPNYAYLRENDAPLLPPPATERGLVGWLWRNLFQSMTHFYSLSASIKSILMILLTFGLFYVGISVILDVFQFSVIDAVWSDPDGLKRSICTTIEQGGVLADGTPVGACWPFIQAKWKLIIYGKYPAAELWRVDIVYAILAVGVAWLIIESAPYRKEAGIFMLSVFPVLALILLTGGHFEFNASDFIILASLSIVGIGVGLAGARGRLGTVIEAFSAVFLTIGSSALVLLIALGLCTINFGLTEVKTSDWGGLLVTLVVALTGIVASLPLGILLALGRRSKMPTIRFLCVGFIEFWRGVPLIMVLFMSSVMLPIFLPGNVYATDSEGNFLIDPETGNQILESAKWEFDKLFRALIGVALFSSAYMAEVIRGGLQAIPKGQYEGAMALGLPYGDMTRLIILPQALRIVIPGIVNTFIGLFKDTTLVLIIGLFDLLGQIQSTFTDSSWSTPTTDSTGYLVCAAMFWIFCFGMSRYSVFVENKLDTGHKS